MEFIFEFILELLLEGSIEASKSSKIPKFIRYPLIAIIALFYIALIGLIFWVGISSLKENIILGIFVILAGFVMLVGSVIMFKKTYFKSFRGRKD